MNFLEASVEEHDGKLVLVSSGMKIELPEHMAEALREAGPPPEVIVGIRPEDVTIGEGPYRGVVYVTEPLGRDVLVHMRVGDDIVRAFAPPGTEHEIGAVLSFDINMDKLHVFDKATEKAII